MTSRIIVAIVAVFAAVLSFAAPVAVDAQTPTVTVTTNTQVWTVFSFSDFTDGTYYLGGCSGASAVTSCTFDSMGESSTLAGYGSCESEMVGPSGASGLSFAHGLLSNRQREEPYRRFAVYSDSACTSEVAYVQYTKPTTLPAWRARGITDALATIYIGEAFSTHGIRWWYYTLTPGNVGCTREQLPPSIITRSPVSSLTGLSAGTTYTYRIHSHYPCDESAIATVTFTTEGSGPSGPPPPDPPSGVDGGEPTTAVNGGSVTLSWSNPGDPDIASYEYSIRRAGGPAGEWTTIPGSNADTTSVTIDLATGEARAVNNATPPMVEWTIHLRARDMNGNAGGIFTTTVNAAGAGTVVPALPLAGMATLALLLFLGGKRRRNG